MKKVSVRDISLIVIIILLVLSLVIGFFYIFRNNFKSVESVFDNMLNLKSYSVYIEEYEDSFGDDNYSLEGALQLSMSNGDFEYVNASADDKTDLDDQHYYYNGDLILTGDGINNEVYWYHKPKDLITNREYDYWDSYKELFSVLKDLDFRKEDNNYIFENKFLLNDNLEDGITEFVYGIYDLGEGTVTIYENKETDINFIYQVQEIVIEIKGEKLNTITMFFKESCNVLNHDVCTNKKKLVITFSDYDNVNPELSSEAKISVEKNTAGSWVGEYKNTKNCSDGKSYDELIYLSDEFSWIDGLGFKADIKLFDCENDYYVISQNTYRIEDNKLIIYDTFDEVLNEFDFYGNYFEEVSLNNNIVSNFRKIGD